MTAQNHASDNELLRPTQGSRCQPKTVHDPYPRVVDWGMPEDVNAGDFTFSVLESALGAGAAEIQLTPVEEFGEVSVHFKIGSEYIRQQPLTQIQFGFIAILLSHVATLSSYGTGSQPSTKYFYTQDRKQYFVRFSKIRLGDQSTAILIRLFVTEQATQPTISL
jgi:hypothetical protein